MNLYSRMYIPCLLLALFLYVHTTLASYAQATTTSSNQIRLNVPEKVQQGHAFALNIEVHTTLPAEAQTSGPTVTITWNGRTFPVSLIKRDDTRAHLELLLPMPYDAKRDKKLIVSYENIRVQRSIKPQIVNWTKANIKLNPKYVVPPASVRARTKKERAQAQAVIQNISPKKLYGSIPFARPVKGIITSPYGTQRLINGKTSSIHKGLDFRGATGVPVRAIADGVVALSENFYYSGNTVYIDHGLGLISQYAHLSKLEVKKGDIIKAGELLGLVGATGRVTGPHLHLVIFDLAVSIDPLPFFTAQNKK